MAAGGRIPPRAAARIGDGADDLPEEWRLVREREGESYRWPKRRDEYAPYRVFMGTTRTEGAVQLALGTTIRQNAWGRDRPYVVAFLTGGSPHDPLVEFVAADDFEETRELVAVIRGSDGGRACMERATPCPTCTPSASAPRSTTSGSTPRAPPDATARASAAIC